MPLQRANLVGSGSALAEPRGSLSVKVWSHVRKLFGSNEMSEALIMQNWRIWNVKFALRWSLVLFCAAVWVIAIYLFLR